MLCLAGALTSRLAADSIIAHDNITESSAGADGVDFVGPLYDSFISDAAGAITGLQLILSGADTSSGVVEAGLYADNSTTPVDLIAVLGSVEDGALSDTPAICDITLTEFPPLTDDSLYWIGLSGTTTAQWYYDYDDSGFAVADDFFANQIGVFSNLNDPYQMSVTEGVSTAPEPSSRLLIGTGAVFLALLAAAWHLRARPLRIPEMSRPAIPEPSRRRAYCTRDRLTSLALVFVHLVEAVAHRSAPHPLSPGSHLYLS